MCAVGCRHRRRRSAGSVVVSCAQVSMARSQAPVKRRTGKPVMFRSAPTKQKVKKEEVDPEKEQELRDMKFFM